MRRTFVAGFLALSAMSVPHFASSSAAQTAEGGAPAERGPERVQVGPTLPDPTVLPPNSGEGRRVVYWRDGQRVWAVDETGAVVKTHQVSGRLDSPSLGTYRVWSRSDSSCAVHNMSICWRYMIRFATGPNGGNVGFHEIPTQFGRRVQTDEQLGQPLSGGCLRQSTADAEWMWAWADVGTVVVVV